VLLSEKSNHISDIYEEGYCEVGNYNLNRIEEEMQSAQLNILTPLLCLKNRSQAIQRNISSKVTAIADSLKQKYKKVSKLGVNSMKDSDK